MKKLALLLTLPLLLTFGCTKEDLYSLFSDQNDHNARKSTIVQYTDLMIFQPAGKEGGDDNNVLVPGTEFPPTKGSKATLKRGYDYIQFNLHTTGLPEGAYTVWFVIFNDPSSCFEGCGEDDLMLLKTGVVWATGKVVKANGVGNFSDRLYVGENREPGTQEIFTSTNGAALSDPQGAEVHLIVKYHGLASDDPDILKDQLYTFTGNCGPDDGANSNLIPGFGYQCFDPQAAIFFAPGDDMNGH